MKTFADFQRYIREHRMTIEMDDGVHRSIFFGKPGSSNCHYRLVTYPGGLLIAGDCGSYSFERARDMFEFFRDPHMTNAINPSYWHEKMQAECKRGSQEFSDARFEEAVREEISKWEVTLGSADKIVQEVEAEVLCEPSSQNDAMHLIHNFESSEGHSFDDFYPNCLEWSWSFRWNLFAIVWGIKQYDLAKQGRTQADHDRRVLAGAA
ncbi:hypothetical protein PANO111632_02800 [Paracoccus nototheniae]|uniref:Uncharacterized protein n=1 Tax=Paracoccus nototheniae TaxID=2489002 RepID=A0ABW4DYC3_9RHOB|nr:hypothetical protein [Paracoccus nototheniae]